MEGLVMAGQLILGLSILVTLHEFGHFITAKWFKMRVEKFYLFFDFLFPIPTVLNFAIFKKKVGDTEYGLGWFPLGGYVSIAGMIDETQDAATLAKIRQQRDLIVGKLNKIGRVLNVITISLTGVSTFLNLLQGFIKGIDLAKIAAKIAAVSFPVLAPALPGLLATLTNAKTAALIDPTTGNSRLQKLTSIIGGAALVASIIGGFILVAIALLKSIDAFLEKCDPNNMNSLLPISKEVQDIADAQLQADNTQNLTTYQGFIIEIEIVPYTPTVDRRRAVGKNQSGIVLIQTELSFTTDEQTLINELKLIIDRDNLKAY